MTVLHFNSISTCFSRFRFKCLLLLLLLSISCYRTGGYRVRKSLSVALSRNTHKSLWIRCFCYTSQVNSFSIKFSHLNTELNCHMESRDVQRPPLYRNDDYILFFSLAIGDNRYALQNIFQSVIIILFRASPSHCTHFSVIPVYVYCAKVYVILNLLHGV